MFTGIIASTGILASIKRGSQSSTIRVQVHKPILSDVQLGDSIAVNGVCLTVTDFDQKTFSADIMTETVDTTTFSHLSMGTTVNLEKALRLCDRLGGHLVSGHVDGVGTVQSLTKQDISTLITIQTTPMIIQYMITKGSIAIDGISLTLIRVEETYFTVSIIPHTSQETTLFQKKIGDKVNLETDMMMKYAHKLLQNNQVSSSITEAFLKENGF